MKKQFAILGHPVAHSLSPRLHNAVFEELGLDDREYAFCDTPPDQLEQVIQAMRAGKWEGFSVTIPHKQAVMPLIDELTERAKKVGAVNTILRTVVQNKDGDEEVRLVGDNTDYVGFEKSLEEAGVFTGVQKNALVLGNGGAAQAIITVLIDHGFQVTIASRNPSPLVGNGHVHSLPMVVGYDHLNPNDDWSLIVNTTPVGMHPKEGECVVKDPAWFTAERTYVDIIYTPKMTEFLTQAKKAGGTIVCGDRMFLWQAVEQAKYFTGGEPPLKLMEELLCS